MRGFFNFIFSKLFLCLLIIAAYVAGFVILCLIAPAILSIGAAAAGALALTVFAALSACLSPRPAEFRALWLTAVAALPLFGPALYFAASIKRRGRTAAQLPAYSGKMRYFEEGEEFFAALRAAIDGAQREVLIEFYIIAAGSVFDELSSSLGEALRRGVEVRIITDGLGSALRLPKRQLKRLKELGAEVKIFNRLVPPPLSRLNTRDHRKIAAIDGNVAFFGGMNIADEYAARTRPYGHWKDSAFMLEGEGAIYFKELFYSMWRGRDYAPTRRRAAEADGELRSFSAHADDKKALPPQYGATKGGSPLKGANFSPLSDDGSAENKNKLPPQYAADNAIFLPSESGEAIMPVHDSPFEGSGRASRALCREIFRANERVWIFTPYLCPDERIFEALCDAAERGVDVKIIVPKVPDKRSAYAVTADFAARLCMRGVKVYAYTPGFMHAKAALCDGVCFAGSYNLDCRSMWLNCECGAFFSGGAAGAVARDFEGCLALSAPFKGKLSRAARLLYPLA